jgi:hypothetical protein
VLWVEISCIYSSARVTSEIAGACTELVAADQLAETQGLTEEVVNT